MGGWVGMVDNVKYMYLYSSQVNERLERLRAQDGRIRPEDLGNTWVVGWDRARQIPDSGEVAPEHTDKATGITRILCIW